jgi:hypothetical protein
VNKHSPAPWAYASHVIEDADRKVIIHTIDAMTVHAARLIAAAPEMFAMLQKVAAHFQDTNAPLGEQVLAVIAKAEGDMP